MNRIFVIATLSVEGFHNWPDAPDWCRHLSHRHRHMFHIRVEAPVKHTDRDIEVINLKQAVRNVLHKTFGEPCEFGSASCEDIGEALLREFSELSAVTVLEDLENGAHVERGEA